MRIFAYAALATTFLTVPFTNANASDDPNDIVKNAKLSGEVRYRYEHVDQDGVDNTANAHTVRTNVGLKSGEFKGFQGFVEVQAVTHLGEDRFNSLENDQADFPVVADPDVLQVNQVWIGFNGIADTDIKVGRQKINLDNQRFVGTVGWRQNDQTFDSISISNESIDGLELSYSYVTDVNRIFGDDSPPDNLESVVHLANASYKVADWLNLSAYAYLMDFSNADNLSNDTFGLRATGKVPLNDDWTFNYEAEFATQSEAGDSTLDYDEEYYRIVPGISGKGFGAKLGYEVLGGDGTASFRTPLATLHKFNGWADVFLTTPANGLEDVFAEASYKISGTDSIFDGVKLKAVYHDFSGEEGGDFGNEYDLLVGKTFKLPNNITPFKKVNVLMKYADYNADDAPYVDKEVFWLQFGVKF